MYVKVYICLLIGKINLQKVYKRNSIHAPLEKENKGERRERERERERERKRERDSKREWWKVWDEREKKVMI